jgi:transcriptional regulator
MHPNPAFRPDLRRNLTGSNPIARAALPASALIAVSGLDAYVSPDWYGAEDQVPTWNDVAVHLRGMLEPLPEGALRPHADALSAEPEGRTAREAPWTSAEMSDGTMPRMLRMILPFRFRVLSVEGTWTLNQNKPADMRARAAAALAKGDAGAQAIAALMREI